MSDDTTERMRLTAMLNSLGAEYAGLLQINERIIAERDALKKQIRRLQVIVEGYSRNELLFKQLDEENNNE